MARAPKKRSARARSTSGKRARRTSAKSWQERLTPQQKAAITRARNAVVKARRGSARERAAREQLAATLERAGASRRSAGAASAAVVRGKAKKKPRRPAAPAKSKKPSKPRRPAQRPPPPAAKPKAPRAPRKLSGKEWEASLTPQQRRTIARTRLALETAPPQTTPARRAEWQRRRARYVQALRRTNITEASIRARLAASERRRITVRNIRDGVLGRSLDAGAYKQDWRILNNLQANRDPRFFEFIEAMEEMGFDEDTAVDFWYSPEALD